MCISHSKSHQFAKNAVWSADTPIPGGNFSDLFIGLEEEAF